AAGRRAVPGGRHARHWLDHAARVSGAVREQHRRVAAIRGRGPVGRRERRDAGPRRGRDRRRQRVSAYHRNHCAGACQGAPMILSLAAWGVDPAGALPGPDLTGAIRGLVATAVVLGLIVVLAWLL